MSGISLWLIGWSIGGAVVLLVALLLIATIVTASGIQREAARALAALRSIDANTRAIWTLGSSAKRFNAIHEYFEALESRTAELGAAPGGESAQRREA